MICSADEGCDRLVDHPVSNLCHKHYARWKRTGTTALSVRHPPDRDGERWCRVCETWQDLSHFRPAYNTQGRTRMRYCRSCETVKNNAWREANPDQFRELARIGKIRRMYGERGVELDAQRRVGAGCEVCGTKTNVHIDHDHQVKGYTRGLLCSNCNTALGLLGEDEDRIKALLDYMGRHKVAGR